MQPSGRTATRARAAAAVGVDALIARYAPQLAVLASKPPRGAGWVHELKLDGYRAGAAIAGGEVRLRSRRGGDLTAEFPEVCAALRALPVRDALIDGEIVMLDAKGRTSFQALQNRARSRRGLTFFAFDLVWLDGVDLAGRPLVERKRALAALLDGAPAMLRYAEHFEVDGEQMFRHACELGAEGVVSKRASARYHAGVRSETWQKTKCDLRQEFVVGGFTDPTHPGRGLGSLLIGYHAGGRLVWAGKVSRGYGLGDAALREVRGRLEAMAQTECPFDPPPPGWLGKNAHWVRPELVAEVKFSEWTDAGMARHPTLIGFRTDKRAADVVREGAAPPPKSARAPTATVAGVAITSPDRAVFPGVTRVDLARFYEDIADWALPHLTNRPMTLVRCHGSIKESDALRCQCQFLRHTADSHRALDGVPRLRIQEKKKLGEYVYLDGLPALLTLFNAGIIELHVWNARVDDPERPDRVVFDLDPGDGASWTDVLTAARAVRAALDDLGLASWPRTTGGQGLHVVVPFARDVTWDDAFGFSRAFAEGLAARHPFLTTSFSKDDRTGKILLDYKRNYRTSIAVASYSIRARPHAPLAIPLSWREVTPRLRPDQFTLANTRHRLSRLRTDPWSGYTSCKQRLTPAIRAAVVM